MSVLAAAIVRELGMMHLVTGNESYKTTSGMITWALGRIDELQVRIGGIQCTMTFMVVDTDGYDVLLGLDFLMKIGAVLDVERGLIQVRHGPGIDVEVLPLTMVNLLQKMSTGALEQEPSTTQKDAPAAQDDDAALDQVLESIQEGDGVSFSNSDDDDNSEYHDSESNQFKQVDSKDEFADAEFEELVSSEGPQEMLRLMLQEQADEIMTEQIEEGDDYADWIIWVSDAEKSRQAMCNVPTPQLSHQHSLGHDSALLVLLQTI